LSKKRRTNKFVTTQGNSICHAFLVDQCPTLSKVTKPHMHFWCYKINFTHNLGGMQVAQVYGNIKFSINGVSYLTILWNFITPKMKLQRHNGEKPPKLTK
jgi:hypothetical protein